MTQFDFSHLYRTETVPIAHDGKTLFTVTVREIPHGVMTDLQAQMLGQMQFQNHSKRLAPDLVKSIKGGMNPNDFNDGKTIAGIQSWTLQDANGDDVPVTIEAFKALPHAITEQIESAIERLNPELDDDFRGNDDH